MLANKKQPEFDASQPISEAELLSKLVHGPADAVEIGKTLPDLQRARIAAFCYNRVHMRELGLQLASTCDLMTLKSAFGRAGEVVYKQSRDVEKTIGSLKNSANHAPRPITLKGSITG